MNLLTEIIPGISREEEFVLCHARVGLSGPALARVDRLTETPLDWKRIESLATAHRIRALLYRHLKSSGRRRDIPRPTWKDFEGHAFSLIARNARQASELVRIVKVLRNENISTLPFKGPVLAAHLYGDVALREFGDLDLLVRKEDLLRTKLLLIHNKFSSASTTNVQKDEHLDTQVGSELVGDDGEVRVEIHSSLDEPLITRNGDAEGVWKRATWVDVAGAPLRTISREDLFRHLCAEGTKHYWDRLSRIIDVAEFIRAEKEIDWVGFLEQARERGHWRVIALGLYLAYGLLDATLPRDVVNEISAPEIKELARSVGAWLFNEEKRPTTGAMAETRFFWKTKERISDRLSYSTEFLKRRFLGRREEQK